MSMPSWAWWLISGVLGLVAFVAALPWLVRPLFRLLLWPRYRLRVLGLEHVPRGGPVLLASNHLTWIDGFLLAAVVPRRGKALVYAPYVDVPVVRWIARRAGLIPVPARGPRAQRAAIEAARQALGRGEAILIFPEAQLARTGLMGPFHRGLEVMIKGPGPEAVPVIPVHLGNLWGSLFSFSGGRFLRKRPRGLRRTVVIAFGRPVPPPVTAFAVRQAVLEAGVRAAALGPGGRELPETIDRTLPRWEHPELGLLAVSAADYRRGDVHQTGQKPGTVGQAAPGVALRVVDEAGRPLPPEGEGRLQALLPGRPDWVETGRRGSLDRDGFVRID
ncbi:MAG TPA: 1-acyl-sn-glycerol-3-phosphate acyltransferase [Isosphaeraceae bacterium]|jgi:1-acyl-sn-glycerol-3-phosphate acyltransferase